MTVIHPDVDQIAAQFLLELIICLAELELLAPFLVLISMLRKHKAKYK
jgi:hypothetical protein